MISRTPAPDVCATKGDSEVPRRVEALMQGPDHVGAIGVLNQQPHIVGASTLRRHVTSRCPRVDHRDVQRRRIFDVARGESEAVHLATAVAIGADRFITNHSRDFTDAITEIDIVTPADIQ